MNREVAQLLKARLTSLTNPNPSLALITKLSGLVRVARIAFLADGYLEAEDDEYGKGKPPKEVIVEWPVPFELPANGELPDATMAPDDKERCIVYFEDVDCIPLPNQQNDALSQWRSTVRLVCWFNQEGFTDPNGITAKLLVLMYRQLQAGIENPFPGIIMSPTVKITRVTKMDRSLFSKYNYEETRAQYLSYPFGYFGIDVEVTYFVSYGCLGTINIKPFAGCCD